MNSVRLIWPLLLAGAWPALAQTPPASPAYDSAFAGYRSYREPQAASWKETNEQLRKRPGPMAHMGNMEHMGHETGAAPKVADPHAGHDMSKMDRHPAPAKGQADPQHGHGHDKEGK